MAHIAEHCITDLKSAVTVAKLLGQRYVEVPRDIYEKLWRENHSMSCEFGWFEDKKLAIICNNGCWPPETIERIKRSR